MWYLPRSISQCSSSSSSLVGRMILASFSMFVYTQCGMNWIAITVVCRRNGFSQDADLVCELRLLLVQTHGA